MNSDKHIWATLYLSEFPVSDQTGCFYPSWNTHFWGVRISQLVSCWCFLPSALSLISLVQCPDRLNSTITTSGPLYPATFTIIWSLVTSIHSWCEEREGGVSLPCSFLLGCILWASLCVVQRPQLLSSVLFASRFLGFLLPWLPCMHQVGDGLLVGLSSSLDWKPFSSP